MVIWSSTTWVVVLVLWLAVGAIVGAVIGSSKGRTGLGLILGVLGGAIGWVVIAVLPPAPGYAPSGPMAAAPSIGFGAQPAMYRECAECKEPMRRDARLCPHCRSESEPWRLHEGRWWVTRSSGSYYLDAQTQQWVRYDATVVGPPPA